jgi:uncharacterized protein YndB with AHSA1/START domain
LDLELYFVEKRRTRLKIQKSIKIAAPASKIWPFLVEPRNILKWCPVEIIRHTGDQHRGKNTPFYFEEKAIGRLFMMNFVVTEWVENESVAFQMTSGNIVKGYEQRYTIQSIPSGSQFTCFEDVKLPYGVLGRVAGLLRRFVSEGRLERMLDKLKVLAES